MSDERDEKLSDAARRMAKGIEHDVLRGVSVYAAFERHLFPYLKVYGESCAREAKEASQAEIATLRHDLEVARGLLRRWQNWRSDGTQALVMDTDAFLAPSAPTTPTVGPPHRHGIGPCLPPCPAYDPYCHLAASEIPNFGTNLDKHRCPKLHRDKPLPRTDGPTKGTP